VIDLLRAGPGLKEGESGLKKAGRARAFVGLGAYEVKSGSCLGYYVVKLDSGFGPGLRA
jgi:hypothetical protein